MGLPIGVEPTDDAAARVRVWAAGQAHVELVVGGVDTPSRAIPLAHDGGGYFGALVGDLRVGERYGFRLGASGTVHADPASRHQPDGPFGLSRVVDPRKFAWSDASWPGARLDGRAIYEMHVGTFTREGTWEAARARLPWLADLGAGVVEMMPVADFPGRFGWGYDGVCLFAPTRLYGTPDDLRRFVDTAHSLGLGVILDVVYNHIGPAGSTLTTLSPGVASASHRTQWGPGFDYDGPCSGPVRELIVANAAYWIDEFHFDGLRLDATQDVTDDSEEHVLAAIVTAVRDAAKGRDTLVLGENEPQRARLVRPRTRGGFGMDAVWNDDFHHAARVALTGVREAYYQDYTGSAQELVSALKYGFLFQGQRYAWQNARRGSPAWDLAPRQFVAYLESHDQVANDAVGRRLHQLALPGRVRAMTAVLLLAPATPMLFQGQEFGARTPFTYFADHEGELATAVRNGRRAFLSQFPSVARELDMPDPGRWSTFAACKLDWTEPDRNGATVALYRDLLAMRRRDPTFAGRTRRPLDGAVLAPQTFVLRFFGEAEDGGVDRLVLVNLGPPLHLSSCAEPLVGPVTDAGWNVTWSSDDLAYGGRGKATVDRDGAYDVPGWATVVLEPGVGP
jgi:maltooligosyltrehalose trehalohydrolase